MYAGFAGPSNRRQTTLKRIRGSYPAGASVVPQAALTPAFPRRIGFQHSPQGRNLMRHLLCLIAACAVCFAADKTSAPSLTIYNQNFAVVRQDLPLELKAGTTSLRVTDITMHLEPNSVILRDPSGKRPMQVLEQNYRADPVSEALLLSLYEGKTIDFLVQRGEKQEVVPGKIIRKIGRASCRESV